MLAQHISHIGHDYNYAKSNMSSVPYESRG